MKKLYYTTCSYAAPHTGVLIDYMLSDVDDGNDVYWAYCNQIQSSCFINKEANEAKCMGCKVLYKSLIGKYGHSIKTIPLLRKKDSCNCKNVTNYKNAEELRALEYKKVKIGLSILSYYISHTREQDVEITKEKKCYFDYIINDCCRFVDSVIEVVNQVKPDVICIHNGRYYENRALYDIAQDRNIQFESAEVVGGFNEPYKSVKYTGDLPHSIKNTTKAILHVWEISSDEESEKIKIGSSFYEKRRAGIPAADKVYISGQVRGKLPNDVNVNAHNIVIFNSSSDEIAALGGEWDDNTMFKSQYDAIRFLLLNKSEDEHYFLRIHPNLKGVPYSYHRDLYKLADEFDCITVIPPESSVSSYALLDIAEKVLVFGSTMGVEACYWGKPVVLVGPAWYSGLDVCYKPKTPSDFISLMKNPLSPKKRIEAIKYAYYLLDRKYRVKDISKVNVNVHFISLLGKNCQIVPYLTVGGSRLLAKVLQVFFTNILKYFYKDKNRIPKS